MRTHTLYLLFTLITACCIDGAVKGQEADTEPADYLEELAETSDLSENLAEEFTEELERLRRNPILLHQASAVVLSELPFLDPLQTENLINYIRRYGAPVNLAELATVEGFSEELAKRVLPYVSFHRSRSPNWKESFKQAESALSSSFRYILPLEKGYTRQSKSPFSGSPLQQRLRGRLLLPGKAEIGFSAEKDEGEPFQFRGSATLYDYLSGYLLLHNPLPRVLPQLSSVLLGDFTIHAGYGLIVGQGFGFRKAGFVADGARPGRGFTPHTGYNETDYERGLAFRMEQGRWSFEGFGSIRRRDAILGPNPMQNKGWVIRSFPTGGLHRTPTERERKNNVREAAAGATMGYSGTIIDGGLRYVNLRYNIPVMTNTSYFAAGTVRGARHENYGIHLRIKTGKAQLFGEWAGYNGTGKALYAGIQTRPGGGFTVEVAYRNYNRWYAAPLGRGFGQSSKNANEEGVYIHLSKKVTNGLSVTAYGDFYQSGFPKYRANGPTKGWQIGFRGEQNGREGTVLRLDYRIKMKQENGPVQGSKEEFPQPKILHRLKYSGSFRPSPTVLLKTEITGALLEEPGAAKKGALLCGTLRYTGNRIPLKAEIWAARISSQKGMETLYTMQRSAISHYSSTPCTGRATQLGLWLEWRLSRKITIRQKSSCWFYDTFRTGGSGSTSWSGWCKANFELTLSLGNST